MCFGCFCNLAQDNSEFVDWDNKPFCKPCFDKLPSELRRKLVKYKDMELKMAPNV